MCGKKDLSTPNINSLIRDGMFFDHTIASSDYTIPCIQSIFTGQFPVGCGKTKEEYRKLLAKDSNYLSLLKENGYSLYATMGNLLYTLGLGEYFDNDDMVFEDTQNLHNGLGERILKKIDDIATKEPWFYYIHLLELHRPCDVPPTHKHLKHIDRYKYNLSVIDSWIGKLIKKIDLEKTLLVLTADHGDYVSETTSDGVEEKSLKTMTKSTIKKLVPAELRPSLHEKKQNILRRMKTAQLRYSHEKRAANTRPMKQRFLFDDFVRVPLILAGYSIKPKDGTALQVRSIDIMPSILDISDISDTANSEGSSVIPMLTGKDTERPVYMENAVLWTSTESPEPSIGIRTNDYKYFRDLNDSSRNVHLYNLKNDPLEDENIAQYNIDLIKRFEKIIADITERSFSKQEETEKLNDKSEKMVEDELRKLGYV